MNGAIALEIAVNSWAKGGVSVQPLQLALLFDDGRSRRPPWVHHCTASEE
jgi:hypothetical protein